LLLEVEAAPRAIKLASRHDGDTIPCGDNRRNGRGEKAMMNLNRM